MIVNALPEIGDHVMWMKKKRSRWERGEVVGIDRRNPNVFHVRLYDPNWCSDSREENLRKSGRAKLPRENGSVIWKEEIETVHYKRLLGVSKTRIDRGWFPR